MSDDAGILRHPAPFIILATSVTMLGLSVVRNREIVDALSSFQGKLKALKPKLAVKIADKCAHLIIRICAILLLWSSILDIIRIFLSRHLVENTFTYILDASIIFGIAFWLVVIALFELFGFSFRDESKFLDFFLNRHQK